MREDAKPKDGAQTLPRLAQQCVTTTTTTYQTHCYYATPDDAAMYHLTCYASPTSFTTTTCIDPPTGPDNGNMPPPATGGGSPPPSYPPAPPENNEPPVFEDIDDPCANAISNNTDAELFLTEINSADALNSLGLNAFEHNISTDINEKAVLLGYNLKYPEAGTLPITKQYTISTVSYGTAREVKLPPTPPGMIVVGAIHTHPSTGYAPPSAADIYTFHAEVAGNTEFRFYFNYAADGSKYMMTVTDQDAFNSFVTNYPKSSNVESNQSSDNFNGWVQNSTIGKEFKKTETFLISSNGMSRPEAYENAFAYILGKYTGVTLSKMDSNGDFKSIFVKKDTTKKEKKNKNPVLPATSNCQ